MSFIAMFVSVFALFMIPIMVVYSKYWGEKTEAKQPFQFFYFNQCSNQLPIILVMTALIGRSINRFELLRTYIPACLSIIITIAIYNIFLLAFLPFMRKYLSSTVITSLWVMPNILYIFVYIKYGLNTPYYVFYIPPKVYWSILEIWFVGFLIVYMIRVMAHLRFRHAILKIAFEEKNEEILALWDKKKECIPRLPRKLPLYRSPYIQSPLSIGVWKIIVVLPEKDYAENELNWIFLHELTHISRKDASTKMYLTFCNALFWFFPPSWKLISKVSEDMELSCDEIVLLKNQEANPKEYANLILDCAACDTGFTTCLSSSGACMSYRLKQIMHPVKANIIRETIIIMAACVLLIFACGRVQISSEKGVLSQFVFHGNQSSQGTIEYDGSISDLLAYLDSETVYSIAGREDFSGPDKSIDFEMGNKSYTLEFRDNQVSVREVDLDSWDVNTNYYYLKTNRWKEIL